MKINAIAPTKNNEAYKNKLQNIHKSNIRFGQRENSYKKYNNADSYFFWKNMRDRWFDSIDNVGDFDPNYTNPKTGIPLLAATYRPSILGRLQFSIDFWYVNKLRKKAINIIIYHPEFNPFLEYFDKKDGCKRNYFTDAVRNNDDHLLTMLFARSSVKGKISEQLYNDLLDLAKSEKIKDVLNSYRPKTDDGIPYGINPDIADILRQSRSSNKDVVLDDTSEKSPKVFDSTDNKPSNNDKNIRLSSMKKFSDVPASLDDLGGMQEAKKIIREFIILPWQDGIRDKLKQNNISMPNGFLMYGPPGCGKTYITRAIANQTGFPMYEVDLATIGGQLAYETNNRLKKVFTELEAKYKNTGKPNILFLDEIDSIAASRKIGHTDWKKDEINTLISLINNVSEKGIILIGATNLLENVDEAVLRPGRFDKKIYIGLPDKKSRKDIFDKMIRRIPVAQNLAKNTDLLAELTKGRSNAELSAILNECCRNAICHNRDSVSLEDFKKTMAKNNKFSKQRQMTSKTD